MQITGRSCLGCLTGVIATIVSYIASFACCVALGAWLGHFVLNVQLDNGYIFYFGAVLGGIVGAFAGVPLAHCIMWLVGIAAAYLFVSR